MLYERKIRYLDYFEQEERIRGTGFAKLEARDTTLRIEITIKNAPISEGAFSVFLMGTEKEASLGELFIQEGNGIFQYTCRITDEIGGTGISYEELTGIRIPLEVGKEIACRWEVQYAAKSVSVKQSKLQAQELVPMADKISAERIPEEGYREESMKGASCHAEENSPKPVKEENQCHGEEKNLSQNREEEKMIRLQEDKWTQLCTIYPHIRPFRDEREYLSISPADFVLFPAADYRAAHNSFLLHGYYNYHHLILTRLERRGEILYYLGVPGNYFEKEKQVAVMFGFESFECAEEPAEYGDFGYYMMCTNI